MGLIQRNAQHTRWVLRIALDRLADWFYSIDTVPTGALPLASEASRYGDAYVNGPVSYWILRSYLDSKRFRPDEVFYDIGCGHGRVLCMVARRRISRCIGVELSAEFAKKARANLEALRGRLSPIEVRVGDAALMDYADGTTFYFGDPFGAKTMRAVLKRIGDTLVKHPREVRCIFVLPLANRSNGVRKAIQSSGWLRFVEERSLAYSPMRAEHWAWKPDSNGESASNLVMPASYCEDVLAQ